MPGYDAETVETKPLYSREQVVEMNLAFARAMILARKRKLERFVIGVFVDNTPMVPAYFDKPLRRSPMQSSAAYCADIGDYSGSSR